jgi:O-antigen/teichoic acid export membrane protein
VVFKTGINGYLYAQIISLIVSVLYLYYATAIGIRIFKEKVNRELLKQMLKFSIPMILNALSWWILHSTDKIMIRQYISEGAVGIYSVSSKIPSLINTVTFFFSEAWFIAAITDYDSDKDNSFYEKTFRVYNFILCGIVACILLVLKPFMSVYVGKEFTESWTYVPLLLIATLFRNYSDFFGLSLLQQRKAL